MKKYFIVHDRLFRFLQVVLLFIIIGTFFWASLIEYQIMIYVWLVVVFGIPIICGAIWYILKGGD